MSCTIQSPKNTSLFPPLKKIQIRNRRAEIAEGKQREFAPVFKCELWKLNQEGDSLNEDHWLKREMWIAKNGAFCYFSKKENRELQYYTASDVRHVRTEVVQQNQSCKANAFQMTLPPTDGLEYAPGVFAATSEQDMHDFLRALKKFKA